MQFYFAYFWFNFTILNSIRVFLFELFFARFLDFELLTFIYSPILHFNNSLDSWFLSYFIVMYLFIRSLSSIFYFFSPFLLSFVHFFFVSFFISVSVFCCNIHYMYSYSYNIVWSRELLVFVCNKWKMWMNFQECCINIYSMVKR